MGMKNYINEGIEPEVREIDDYVISVSFDKNWLCFEAQIIDKKNAELYFESGPSRESTSTDSTTSNTELGVISIKYSLGMPPMSR